jgi:hypothetical protein
METVLGNEDRSFQRSDHRQQFRRIYGEYYADNRVVPAKVCSVKLMDAQGRLEIPPVLAHSRNGAAALALEELIKQRRWSRDGGCKIEVTCTRTRPHI